MKNTLALLLLVTCLGLAPGCCGEPQMATGPGRHVDLDRDFYHRDAHINIPLESQGWTRAGITVHPNEKMVMEYARPQTAMTLRVQVAQVKGQSLEERFKVLLRSPAWPGQGDAPPQEIDLGQGATPARGLHASHEGSQRWTHLYLFQQRGWFIYYRVTSEDPKADQHMRELLKAMHIPDPKAEPGS